MIASGSQRSINWRSLRIQIILLQEVLFLSDEDQIIDNNIYQITLHCPEAAKLQDKTLRLLLIVLRTLKIIRLYLIKANNSFSREVTKQSRVIRSVIVPNLWGDRANISPWEMPWASIRKEGLFTSQSEIQSMQHKILAQRMAYFILWYLNQFWSRYWCSH